MVAHDFTDTSFGIPASAFRGSFFQGHAWLKRILPGPRVAPINKIQMKPRFVMAAWIIRSQAQCFSWDGECTMLIQLPKTLRAWWFEKSADVCPIVRNGSRSPQWWGPGGVGKILSINASSIVLRLSLPRYRRAVPLKSPATKSTS